MRRIGVIGAGEFPTDQEQADALDSLKSIYRRLIADGAFGSLVQVDIDADYIAQPGQRIVGHDGVISFPDTPVPDLSLICIVDPSTNITDEYLFDARTQKWQSIDDLLLSTPAPLAQRNATGLASLLAIDLAPEFGQQIDPTIIDAASKFQIALSQNWLEEPPFCPGSVYY